MLRKAIAASSETGVSYRTAAVCEDGHCLGAMFRADSRPDKFCKHCGKRVFTRCPHCNAQIRGAPYSAVSAPGYHPPNYCPECGQPFPWTSHELERAKKAIDQHAAEHGIPEDEAATLKSFADDIVSGAASEVQISGARALLKKFGPAGAVIWNGLTDIAAKTMAAMMKPY